MNLNPTPEEIDTNLRIKALELANFRDGLMVFEVVGVAQSYYDFLTGAVKDDAHDGEDG